MFFPRVEVSSHPMRAAVPDRVSLAATFRTPAHGLSSIPHTSRCQLVDPVVQSLCWYLPSCESHYCTSRLFHPLLYHDLPSICRIFNEP